MFLFTIDHGIPLFIEDCAPLNQLFSTTNVRVGVQDSTQPAFASPKELIESGIPIRTVSATTSIIELKDSRNIGPLLPLGTVLKCAEIEQNRSNKTAHDNSSTMTEQLGLKNGCHHVANLKLILARLGIVGTSHTN